MINLILTKFNVNLALNIISNLIFYFELTLYFIKNF